MSWNEEKGHVPRFNGRGVRENQRRIPGIFGGKVEGVVAWRVRSARLFCLWYGACRTSILA